MDLSTTKIDESHDALTFEFSSPEEEQFYSRALVDRIPEGYAYVVRRGMSNHKDPKTGKPIRRVTRTLALAKIGESLTLPTGADGEMTTNPVPKPAKLDVPDVVMNADKAQREVMAVRNGIVGEGAKVKMDQWRSWSEARQRAALADAMKKQNAA